MCNATDRGAPSSSRSAPEQTCTEKFGNTIEGYIHDFFNKLGIFVGTRPRLTILLSIILTALCGYGFTSWTTENRADKLWVPQDTIAEIETEMYQTNFASTSRFNSMIVSSSKGSAAANVLTKETLLEAMKMHNEIETSTVVIENEDSFGDDQPMFLILLIQRQLKAVIVTKIRILTVKIMKILMTICRGVLFAKKYFMILIMKPLKNHPPPGQPLLNLLILFYKKSFLDIPY